MAEQCKILFLSAPIGSGHVRAAQAVGAAVRTLSPTAEISFANVFDFFSPVLGRTILRSYLRLLDLYPRAYGMMYGWGNTSRFAVAGRELISRFLADRMFQYIQLHSPTAIVCTHATPAGLVAHLCKTARITIPVFAVVTDFVVHRLWVYPEIDTYFVADDAMRTYLDDQGISLAKSRTTGIPVDEKFTLPSDRAKTLTTLGLSPDRKTLLIMGGGAGVLPMADIITVCEELAIPLQIIAVAGHNRALLHQLDSRAKTLKWCTLRPLGFVNNVHDLMAVSNLLISKPGGMTAAEALCRGLPLLIFRPIPGQEEANTRYLIDHAAGESVHSPQELQTQLTKLLIEQPDTLSVLHQRATALGRPTAAQEIAQAVLAAVSAR